MKFKIEQFLKEILKQVNLESTHLEDIDKVTLTDTYSHELGNYFFTVKVNTEKESRVIRLITTDDQYNNDTQDLIILATELLKTLGGSFGEDGKFTPNSMKEIQVHNYKVSFSSNGIEVENSVASSMHSKIKSSNIFT